MERIDRKKTSPAIGESHAEQPYSGHGGEPASQWLDAAMAMWVEQEEPQAPADHPRHVELPR